VGGVKPVQWLKLIQKPNAIGKIVNAAKRIKYGDKNKYGAIDFLVITSFPPCYGGLAPVPDASPKVHEKC